MQEHTSDWLASSPVFYNEKTGKVSENINEVIDFRNLEFHPEGLNNYLDFGYSVFRQTPVRHVRFLRHSSRLSVSSLGRVSVEELADPAELVIDSLSGTEDEVLELLRGRVRRWEESVKGDIVIPTSGGYDSRLLNFLIRDRSRIRSYTYGLSTKSECSSEVVYARKVSEILGTRWQRVDLGDFHGLLNEWDGFFGCSTHQHGMYQMAFYRRIRQSIGAGRAVLSGMIGDAWAGGMYREPGCAQELTFLSVSHGARAEVKRSRLKDDGSLRLEYLRENREKLQDPRWRVIEAMRLKMILLTYLLRVPRNEGFHPWTPFLDMDIALMMLNLPQARRSKRIWQRDLFRKHSLAVEEMGLLVDVNNTLNQQAVYQVPLTPLDRRLLSEIVDPAYVDWINRSVSRSERTVSLLDRGRSLYNGLFRVPKLGGMMWKVGLRDREDLFNTYYYAYLTLRSVQNLILRRNRA